MTVRDLPIEILEDKDGNDANDNSDGCNRNHHCCDQHQVSYDELGNERHKAIAELRKLCERNVHIWKAQINMALGLGLDASNEDLCDRLIYLLGGDQPTLSDLYGILQDGEESENKDSELAHKITKSAEIAKPESDDGGENCRTTDEKLNGESLIESLVKSTEELSRQGKVKFPPNEDGSIESLKTVEETAALIDEVESRADQSHESSPMRLENETRITDELREFATDPLLGYASQELHVERITTIADRIDEQFDRICEQQEVVLQHTIDTMVDERDELRAMLTQQRDEARAKVIRLDNEVSELRRSLRQIVERAGVPHDRDLSEYGDGQIVRAIIWQLGETKQYVKSLELVRDSRLPGIEAERDELQEKCDRLKTKVEHQREQLAVYATMYDFDAIRALKRERNEHKHRADNAEGHVKSLERRLDAAHETYCALLNDAAREFRALTEERDELQASLRKIAERAGVPHDSEFDEYSDETVIVATLAQIDSTHGYVGALEWQRDRQKKLLDEYDQTHVELPKDANGEYIHIDDVMDGYAKTIKIMELRYGRIGWVLISRDGNEYADTFAFAHHHNPTVEQVIRDLTLGKITEAQAIERIEGING